MRTSRIANWMVDAEDAGLSQSQINRIVDYCEGIWELAFNHIDDELQEMFEEIGLEALDEEGELTPEYKKLTNTIDFTDYLFTLLEIFKAIKK